MRRNSSRLYPVAERRCQWRRRTESLKRSSTAPDVVQQTTTEALVNKISNEALIVELRQRLEAIVVMTMGAN
jgi:hypothetical protein